MFLRNWYQILKVACYGAGSHTNVGMKATNASGVPFEIYNYVYNSYATIPYSVFPQTNPNSNSNTGSGIIPTYIGALSSVDLKNGGKVCFGSGVTPPTLDDYCLENQYTNQIQYVTSGVKRAIIGNTVNLEYSYTLTNTGDTDALISEIGIVVPIQYKSTGDSGLHPCFIDRTVLTEPVTITPGNMEVITYTITYNLPSPE